MKVDPLFTFDGNCREAMDFYRDLFDGTPEVVMTWAESPMADDAPPGFGDKILHMSVNIGQTTLMGSDAPPGRFRPAAGTVMSIPAASMEEGERLFSALSEGGTVQMPWQPTFWAKGFGMVTDRFGIPWTVGA